MKEKTKSEFIHVRNVPGATTIFGLVQNFWQQGAVCDLPCAGRPRGVCSYVIIVWFQEGIEKNTEICTRRRSMELGTARRSCTKNK